MKKPNDPIAILGAGSWGTALAIALARNGQNVKLWGNNLAHLEQMARDRCNAMYLPNIHFPNSIEIAFDLKQALADVRDILIVVPSHAFRSMLQSIKPWLKTNARLAWATKGLDSQSGKLLHEVAREILTNKIPLAVLSGPSFAMEVAIGLPTAITVAATSKKFAQDISSRFHKNTFRIYLNNDLIGVQIGGTVKNVLAIATGIADGLGLGANARAALLTRGLAEMLRLGKALGGKQATFMGLAGLGDLILTGTDNQSRNRRFGIAIGKGIAPDQAEQEIGQVVEGKHNTAEVYQLAQRLQLNMPIVEQVYQVIYQGLDPKIAVNTLMSRQPKAE